MSYRKLPGHRRGFLYGASLWLAPDHILAVKSLRFREEYQRFYLRDIQAIVVATRPRFHLSTRAGAIGALWLAVLIAALNRAPWVPAVMSAAAIALLLAWFYVSYARSCSCRIYTAVSRAELPSIYRTWTARQFLAELEPLIRQVQGVLPADWAERIEDRPIGPRPKAAPLAAGGSVAPAAASAARSRTPASDIFVASLLGGAALQFFALHSMTRMVEWTWYALAFIEIAGAVAIFVQHHRGILRAGMQRLAITALILTGVLYYVRQILAGVAMGNRPALPDFAMLATFPGYLMLRQVNAGISLVLGLVGVALALIPESDTP